MSAGGGALVPEPNAAVSNAVASVAWSYVAAWRAERMQSWRPISEFANSKRVGIPSGVTGLRDRVMSNAPHFLTNYLVVALVFGTLTLLLRPLLAILISMPVLLYAYLFVWRRDAAWSVPVLGVAVGDREKWIAVAVVFALVFLYAASDLIWIVGATFCVVSLHAIFYKSKEEHETDTLFEDPV